MLDSIKNGYKELFSAVMQMIMESELPFWSVNQALKEIQGIITYEVDNLPIEKMAEGQKKSRRW